MQDTTNTEHKDGTWPKVQTMRQQVGSGGQTGKQEYVLVSMISNGHSVLAVYFWSSLNAELSKG